MLRARVRVRAWVKVGVGGRVGVGVRVGVGTTVRVGGGVGARLLPMRAARCVVLPPGEAAMSSTRLPGSGARAMTGRKEEADWTWWWWWREGLEEAEGTM